MLTIQDKIFILRAINGGAKFFQNRRNMDTMIEMRLRLGKSKMDEIITKLREV